MLSSSVTVLAQAKCWRNLHTSCRVICPASSAHLMLHEIRPMLRLALAYMGPSDNTHQNLGTVLCLQATLHPFTESWKTVGYYIKFDDDITYIRRGTNEAVLHGKLQEPY